MLEIEASLLERKVHVPLTFRNYLGYIEHTVTTNLIILIIVQGFFQPVSHQDKQSTVVKLVLFSAMPI